MKIKTITTEIVINANKDIVWKILTDFNSYPDWNPFITQIEGELKTGSRFNVTLNIEGRKPTSFQPDIISLTPGEKFYRPSDRSGSPEIRWCNPGSL